MITLDRYQLIFDPFIVEEQVVDWSKVVPRLAKAFLQPTSRAAIFEASNALAVSIKARKRMSGAVGEQIHRVLKRVKPGFGVADGELVARACGMLAALYLLSNGRLKDRNAAKRDSMAIALWPALTFQESLLEPRLEELRKDVLETAQRVALDMAGRSRLRRKEPSQKGSAASATLAMYLAKQQIAALKWNSTLDQEENDLLRWLLADESTLLERPFEDFSRLETLVVTRGLELGRLLRRFPTFEHYVFVSQTCGEGHQISLQRLLDALGEDRERLAGSFGDSPVVQACPEVFPFLTALGDGGVGDRSAIVEQPLAYWCGRAFLESAAATFASNDWSET